MARRKDSFKHDSGEQVTAGSESEANKMKDELISKLQKAIELEIYRSARIWVFRKAWFLAKDELVIEIELDDKPSKKTVVQTDPEQKVET